MGRSRRWRDLSGGQQAAIVALSAVEVVLTATAARDLAHRPASLVRGRRALWWPLLFVQPVGPVFYLIRGRLPGPDASASTTSAGVPHPRTAISTSAAAQQPS
jgi:hypothetical protein